MSADLEEIKKIVQATRAEIADLHKKIEQINRRLTYHAVFGFLKFLVIVIPLIVSLWIFQPQIQKLWQSWQQIFSAFESASSTPLGPDAWGQLRLRYPQLFQQ